MASAIPLHYSNRYVQQRYNKALQIVQHLPASSFQPTKEQKLQLYAFYKQVSIGNVNTPRPGLFDMVGRAKWDAWKKLEGVNKLEAQHLYVETLLQAVSEAYQKPASKTQAQQIIQAFASMRQVGDGDTTDDELTTTTTEDDNNEDEESSQASLDEEEKAYLFDIQQNAGRSTPATVFRQTNERDSAPTTSPRRSSNTNRKSKQQQRPFLRPKSAASIDRTSVAHRNNNMENYNRNLATTSRISPLPVPITSRQLAHTLPRDSPILSNHFDDNVNPWAAQQTNVTSTSLNSATSSDYPPPPPPQQQQQQYRTDSRSTNHTNVSSVQMLPSPIMGGGRLRTLQSPFHGSSAASSVTATMSNVRPLQQRRQQQQQQDPSTQPSQDYAYASIVSLGPATKRALESLQAEVIALNDRIDDLRHELLRRDRQSVATQPSTDDGEGADDWEGWRWVINAAIKYAAVNVLTAFIILVILYKRGSPAAYAVVGKLTKLFYKIRGRLRVTTVVV